MKNIKQTLHLAIPLCTATLSQVAMMFIDTVMMGKLGPTQLAAGALGVAIFDTFFIMGLGFSIAMGSLVATAFGAKRRDDVTTLTRQGFITSILFSIPSFILIWYLPDLLGQWGQPTAVIVQTKLYIHTLVWCLLPSLLFMNLREFTAALARPRIVMYIALGALPFNALFDYILMYGLWGLPEMGIAGIGLATTLVELCMLLCLALHIHYHHHFRDFNLLRQYPKLNKQHLIAILKLGTPISATLLFEVGLFSVSAILMGYFGTVSLAAHQIALQCSIAVYVIPLGIAQATTMRVAHSMGIKNPDGAKQATYTGLGLGFLISICTASTFLLFPRVITSLFLDMQAPENQAVIAQAVLFLRIAAVYQLTDSVQVITNGALRGLKDTFIPMLLGLTSYWLCGLGSSYLLAFEFNFNGNGIWWGMAIGITVSALLLYNRYLRTIRRYFVQIG